MNCFVTTQQGRLKGMVNHGVLQFHGIPYAKAPVGGLRFAMPQAPDPWEGDYDATFRHPAAPQETAGLAVGSPIREWDEDCLTLTVSTPALEGRLPVAVWFHGGANVCGGGDLEQYDGASLARAEQIVVVGVNFRLGALGFLWYPGVNETNLSVEDQLMALRWVRDNIGRFGGDPERVTLFGQSSGANAIAHILSRPDSEGLFRQVLLESPPLGRGSHTEEEASAIGEAVLRALGMDLTDREGLLEQVRAKPAEEILAAAGRVSAELQARYQGMLFKPVMDAWHTPEQTVAAAASEAARRHVRILLGFMKNEMHAFVLKRDPKTLENLDRLQKERYDDPGESFALAASDGGCPVWKYRFDWQAPKSVFHACHCLELSFVFGNANTWNTPMLKGASREEMEHLRQTVQALWGQFFRFEDFDDAIWPRFTRQNQALKCIDNQTNPVIPAHD